MDRLLANGVQSTRLRGTKIQKINELPKKALARTQVKANKSQVFIRTRLDCSVQAANQPSKPDESSQTDELKDQRQPDEAPSEDWSEIS